MKVSRSAFLKLCATAVAGVGAQCSIGGLVLQAAAPGAGVVPASPSGRFDWATASAAMFQPHLRGAFTALASAEGRGTPLALHQVIEATRDPRIEQFSLVFHSSAAETLHGLYTIRHAALGEFELFMSPVGARRGRVASYEACFSRVVQGAAHHG